MTLFNILEPGTAAKARTNMLRLPGNLEGIIDRLSALDEGHGHIQAAVVEVTPTFGEDSGKYFQRVDAAIKDFIRKTLGLPASAGVHYSRFRSSKGVFGFLYLSTRPPEPGQVRRIIAEHSLRPFNTIEALLDLKLKLSFLADVHKHYEIAPVEFNADLYIGLVHTRKMKNGSHVFDALQYSLYFSTQQEIALSLNRKTMKCELSHETISLPVGETGNLMFDWAGKRYQRVDSLDARSESNRNYMAFATNNVKARACDHYHNSINYHQTDCLNRLQRLLEHSGIAFEPVVYEATHQVKAFLEGLPTMSNPLWLLDTAAQSNNDMTWRSSVAELAEKFGATRVITPDVLPSPSELDASAANYLVVSQKVKTPGGSKNGASIFEIATGKSHNTFWQALARKQRDPAVEFDYYTSVKLHRFTHGVDSICQGFDISLDKGPSQASIEKSLQELALKEAIFRDKVVTISGASFPARSVQLFSCQKDQQQKIYIQVLDVALEGEQIKILGSRRYDESSRGEFNHEFENLGNALRVGYKKPFDALWDTAFVIRDRDSKACLTAFNTGRVPAIIGNALFDNQVRQDEGVAPTRKVGIQDTALPYYLTPTRGNQRHSVFIQDNGLEGAWFFVTSNKSANNTIDKQSSVYNATVSLECGTRLPVLNHPLGELFFSTFTYDIVRLRESAKKSILQKIVEVCLHN
ncbi:hypothetical protein [Pseudomonas fluorescens]|uniref:hypothetical protein n=1 Tax=Pseudomonas fluorescens TaxID=294 RepID=UPI00381808FB